MGARPKLGILGLLALLCTVTPSSRPDAGAQPAAPTPPATGAAGAARTARELAEAPATAFQLIDQALADRKIDRDTALLYRAYAAFGNAGLPSQYRGPGGDVSEGATKRVVRQMRAVYRSLSPRVQEAIGPFLVPPYHRGSWADLKQRARAAQRAASPGPPAAGGGAAGRGRPAAPGPAQPVFPCRPDQRCPVSDLWESLVTLNDKVKIWWPKDVAGGRSIANLYANDLHQFVWPTLTGLMGEPLSDANEPNNGGDGRLDIALIPEWGRPMRRQPSPYSRQRWATRWRTSSLIRISSGHGCSTGSSGGRFSVASIPSLPP